MDYSIFKEKIQQHCLEFLHQRLKMLTETEQNLQQLLENETKSSAGDKYETSREMANAELEQNTRKMNESLDMLKTLYLSKEVKVTEKAAFGCLVYTDNGFFFISIPLGRIVVEQQAVFCISVYSPIGQYIANCIAGDQFEVNQHKYKVLGIY